MYSEIPTPFIPRRLVLRQSFMVLALILWAVLPSQADEVFLKNGRVLSGKVIDQTDTQVVIELPAGRMSLPLSMIESVETGDSEVSEYQRRAGVLDDKDADGWLALAFWARDERLDTKSTEAFDKVLSIEPGHVVAREVMNILGSNHGADPSLASAGGRVNRQALDRTWSGSSLAPRDAEVAAQVNQALSLARYGRWAESGWRLRQLQTHHGEAIDASLYAAALYAIERTAYSSNEEILRLFTPDEAHLDRLGCVVSLKFDGASPSVWEWAGSLREGSSFDLSGGVQLELLLPFRRAGQVQHLGTTDRLDVPVLFEGRFQAVTEEDGSFRLSWRTSDDGAGVSRAWLDLRAEADGAVSGEVSSEWRGGVASYRKQHGLADGFFEGARFVRAKVEKERISFGIEEGFTDGLALPISDGIFLDIEGDGAQSTLDWISISGPVDGLWLARRLAIRSLNL